MLLQLTTTKFCCVTMFEDLIALIHYYLQLRRLLYSTAVFLHGSFKSPEGDQFHREGLEFAILFLPLSRGDREENLGEMLTACK